MFLFSYSFIFISFPHPTITLLISEFFAKKRRKISKIELFELYCRFEMNGKSSVFILTERENDVYVVYVPHS